MKTKKRKLKLKKKNFCIFIFIILLIITSITLSIKFTISLFTNKYNKSLKTNNVIKKNNNTKKEKKLTELEKKLQKLGNINKKIDFFKDENIDRYLTYKEQNQDLDNVKVILDVNMNIDSKQYTNEKKAFYLNKEYILVNKYNYLDENYIPDNLEKIDLKYARSGMKLVDYAKDSFESLAKDAKKEGLNIMATSSYRSYNYQVDLYNKYAEKDGYSNADTYSARPGFSEHQTGLAVDVYDGNLAYTDFEQTKEFTWMQKHAQDYGFILRFPKDKEKETGYEYESWHYRYVGKEMAKDIKEKDMTFEEYYVRYIENKK